MLRCARCGEEYADRWRCACGGPLEFADPPEPAEGPEAAALDPRAGLWAFEAFLPVERRVTLGEGYTPLVRAPGWDADVKLEYVSPTGSFKDRGATTTLSRAVEVDAEHVLEDSSGNAGAAIATYAARAGLDATVYVPAGAADAKVRAIRRAGATIERVEGSRQDVTDACIEAVEAGEGWYASHAWNPAFYAGTATVAYEIAHQRDWDVPDAVVVPVGHGTLLLGAYRGFGALAAAGWTDRVPRLLGAQATGTAPLVADRDGAAAAGGGNDLADGIQVDPPARREQLHEAVDETDGDVIAVDAEATATERERLHRAGFYVEATSAVAPAALRAYRERGVVGPDDDVVVPLTGSGKTG